MLTRCFYAFRPFPSARTFSAVTPPRLASTRSPATAPSAPIQQSAMPHSLVVEGDKVIEKSADGEIIKTSVSLLSLL